MYRFNTDDFLIRLPLFIIFFWFGLLKVIELSPARQLIIDTVFWMPVLSAETWVIVIGYWEMFIAIFFLNKENYILSNDTFISTNVWDFYALDFIAGYYIPKLKSFTSYS